MAVLDDGGTVTLYLFPARGGPPRRLGVLPFNEASYVFSADGRRAVASVRETKADIWLVKNLGELLPR